MKVVQINSVYGVGSTGRIAADIHDSLLAEKNQSFVIYGRGSRFEGGNKHKIGNKIDLYYHILITRLFDLNGFGSIRPTRKLISWLKECNPDIIHLHNIHGYYLNIPTLFDFLSKYQKPVVWTLHDCWAFTGHCSHFENAHCTKWINGCGKCPNKHKYPASWFFDRSYNNYIIKRRLFSGLEDITFVVPSFWLHQKLEQSFLSQYNRIVIQNGVETNLTVNESVDIRSRFNIPCKKILLGVASYWIEEKGFYDFLRLSEIMLDDYVIVLVGLSDSQIKHLPNKIIGIPRLSDKSLLNNLYNESEYYLNLSHQETMGMTTIEALACGTPVIVYNLTAIPEVVDKTCGYVVEKDDLASILNILKNQERPDPQNCIKKALKYDKQNMTRKYMNLYKEIVSVK